MAEQYVARNVDNTPKDPQPGDTEITDAFNNIFDNFNTDWKDYDVDNVLVSPQPGYQNLDYVQYTVENTAVSPPWQPDAGQWIARGVDNQVRTPEKYEKTDVNNNIVSTLAAGTLTVTLRVEETEGLIVTEDDVNGIRLAVNHLDYASTRNFG